MKRSKWALLLAALLCIVQAVMPMTVFAFTAQTPTRVPEIGEAVTVYTKADMVLDFSSYTFSVMDSSGTEQSGGIHGLTNVMKIWVATTDQQQFTAYCLDMSRHYPATISNAGEQSLYVKDSDMLLGLFVQTLKAGDTAANGSAPNTSACFGDLMAVHGDITSFRFLSTTAVDQTMLDAFNNDERVQFEINGATFADGYELTRDDGHWIYGFWRKSVVQTDNFVTTAWPSGAVYDKMLWVIEHSYPAISMSTMMHDAGADYDRLYTEIAASQGGLSSAELDELVETIVYATIQEAVWHHQPAKVNDDPERFIGAKLIQGHQDTKLLYEYLTQERDEYTNYRSKVFGDSISIEHPADLTPAQNGAGYIYGPFSVSSDMLDTALPKTDSAGMVLKFGIATVALVGASRLVSGKIDVLTLFMFLLVASRLYDPMQAALQNLAAVIAMRTNVARMNEILDHEIQQGGDTLTNKGCDITFDHVGFAYKSGETVLSDVSFTAKQGEVTALVGPSGGGKTTVSRLAVRFWDNQKGKITVGGMDISKIDPEKLMTLYSIVFQDVTLFNNTIMENIRLGRKGATDEEVLAAAHLANCDEFAEKFPDKWNTNIGENGCELSGGERQRISIARAFLKDAPIILLDEATASLDVENETAIQSALSRLIRNKTVLVIAHRMRTITGADKIVVLSDGIVAEQGAPEELLNKNGIFKRMADLQLQVQNWTVR